MLRSAGFALADVTARLAGSAGTVTGPLSELRSGELVSLRHEAGAAGQVMSPRQTADLPALAADQPGGEPQLFSLVDASDPTRVYFHGIDTGNGAFTISESGSTNFGKWNSMQSAFERLDMMTGPHVQLALVMFDSLPVMAVTPLPLGWSRQTAALGPSAVAELEAPAVERDS